MLALYISLLQLFFSRFVHSNQQPPNNGARIWQNPTLHLLWIKSTVSPPPDESIKRCGVRVDEQRGKSSISLLLCFVPSGPHWSGWCNVYGMRDVACVSARARLKWFPGAASTAWVFARMNLPSELWMRLRLSQPPLLSALLPPVSRSPSSLPLKVEEFCWMSQR